MAVENITLNLIPTGDTPSIHVAQYDIERPFTVTLKEGEDDFTPTGYTIELQVRKVDNTIVTSAPSQSSGNVVTFNTTEQMTACSGTNLAEVQLTKDSQTFATLHFYLVVQRDVLAGGVSSASDINNLTQQIAAIVPEVIGDDYYNKEEVDEKIAEIPTFDPTNYYDKSDVDALLNDKADVSDLPDMTNYYDKSETDALLNDKADISDLPDMSNYYTKTEADNKITGLYEIKTATGSLIHITDGGNNIPLKSFESDIVAFETGSGDKSTSNPYTISGFSSGVVSVNSNTYTFAFGQTVYGGHFDNKGNLVVTHEILTLDGTESYLLIGTGTNRRFRSDTLYSQFSNVHISSHFVETGNNSQPWGNFRFSTGYLLLCDNNTQMVDVTALQTWLANQYSNGTPVQFLCELETPTTVTITGQKILTEKICDISSDTGDIELEYFTEKSDGIAELIKAFM